MTWRVAHTKPQAEPDVRREIEKEGHGAFLPYYHVRGWRGQRATIREKPLIPGYVFFDLADGADWSSVNHADGVQRVLLAGDAPAVVSDTDWPRCDRAR